MVGTAKALSGTMRHKVPRIWHKKSATTMDEDVQGKLLRLILLIFLRILRLALDLDNHFIAD